MRFFVVLLVLFCSPSINAYERINGVYEARVKIENRTDEARNKAIQQGLEQVLIRYTGYSGIGQFPELETEFNNAQRYVIEYGVETSSYPLPDGLGVIEGDSLWIRYNANLIDQLAKSLELPIWPTWRPSVQYMVVTQLWGEPHFPSREEQPALFLQLQSIFQIRGLNASYLNSAMSGFNASRIWTMDTQTADRLVQNSTADIVIIIRITPGSPDSTLDMLFMSAGKDTRLRRTSTSLLEGLNDGLNDYIDSLSSQLAFLGGADQDLELYLRVDGVRSFSEYRTLLDQFAGLEQVIFARMDHADDRGVRFLLRYQSDQALLIDSIVAITGLQLIDTTSPRGVLPENEQINNSQQQSLGFGMPGSLQNPLRFFNPDQNFLPRSSLSRDSLPMDSARSIR